MPAYFAIAIEQLIKLPVYYYVVERFFYSRTTKQICASAFIRKDMYIFFNAQCIRKKQSVNIVLLDFFLHFVSLLLYYLMSLIANFLILILLFKIGYPNGNALLNSTICSTSYYSIYSHRAVIVPDKINNMPSFPHK